MLSAEFCVFSGINHKLSNWLFGFQYVLIDTDISILMILTDACIRKDLTIMLFVAYFVIA